MLNLSSFLEKFKLIDKSFAGRVVYIQNAIESATGMLIEPNKIQIKGDKIYINESPTVRSNILMYKAKILENLKSKNIQLDIY
jgi:hypothetical protein